MQAGWPQNWSRVFRIEIQNWELFRIVLEIPRNAGSLIRKYWNVVWDQSNLPINWFELWGKKTDPGVRWAHYSHCRWYPVALDGRTGPILRHAQYFWQCLTACYGPMFQIHHQTVHSRPQQCHRQGTLGGTREGQKRFRNAFRIISDI